LGRIGCFENKELRKLFGCETKDVTGGRRKLHIYEFQNVYSLSDVVLGLNTEE